MKKKTTRILAMLLAALLVLSACGGNNSNSNDTPSNNDPGTSAPAQENNGPGISDVQVDDTLTLEQQLEQLEVDNGGTPLTIYRTYQT